MNQHLLKSHPRPAFAGGIQIRYAAFLINTTNLTVLFYKQKYMNGIGNSPPVPLSYHLAKRGGANSDV